MLLDGRKIADRVISSVYEEIKKRDLRLILGAIYVDYLPGLAKFVALKKTASKKAGIHFEAIPLAPTSTSTELEKSIDSLLPKIQGLIIELPLPDHLPATTFLNLIPLHHDVDVLSDKAQDLFYKNESKILPPTVEALKIILESHNIDLKNKTAAVFGQGILVGKPISHWLEHMGVTVFRVDEFTPAPEQISVKCDIVISGVGKPHFIKPDMIRSGAIIIDFGYENKEGKMVGDFDPSVADKAHLFTPVPGGMGPIVIAAMLKNLLILNTGE